MSELCLDKVDVGKRAIIKKVLSDTSNKKRILDLGFTKGTIIKKEFNNIGKSLSAINIRGTLIALRKKDMQNIIVEAII